MSELSEIIARRQVEEMLRRQQMQDPTMFQSVLDKLAATPQERISQGLWMDANPTIGGAVEGLREMVGVAPYSRILDRLAQAKSPVMRPQTPFGWADWTAGTVADSAQTLLAAADVAALAPAVGRRAGKSLMNELGQVDVWHGSPHKFDKVSHEKIGTGEGAQAFGWGTYYTDKKDIAKKYSEAGKNKYGASFKYDYKYGDSEINLQDLIKQYNPEDDIKLGYQIDGILHRLHINGKGEAVKKAEYYKNENLKFPSQQIANSYNSKIDLLKTDIESGKTQFLKVDEKTGDFIYRAQLFPGKDPSEYTFLDWHKKITEQPKILEVAKKNAEKYHEHTKKANALEDIPENDEIYKKIMEERRLYAAFPDIVKHPERYDGNALYYSLIAPDEGKIYSVAESGDKSKEASLFLKRAGIDGIRYPTETLSGKGPKGGGAYNYVVFDAQDVRLVARESGGIVEDLTQKQIESLVKK